MSVCKYSVLLQVLNAGMNAGKMGNRDSRNPVKE